jgi:tRNA U34 5-carboxymethylaminomethyl modifying enzyme MnmG/GidA
MKNSEQLFESVKKGLINENYIDLQPINNLEPAPKASFETKFAKYLAEEAKAVEKKPAKEVEEVAENNFDYSDVKNLDNQIGQEVLNGIYFESKQNPDKSLEEIRGIVSKFS